MILEPGQFQKVSCGIEQKRTPSSAKVALDGGSGAFVSFAVDASKPQNQAISAKSSAVPRGIRVVLDTAL